uniref:Uncharacterized protein n=1 Tax=Arundo donax TaxID=35708 RepID=A0A0A9HS43_ARUDO
MAAPTSTTGASSSLSDDGCASARGQTNASGILGWRQWSMTASCLLSVSSAGATTMGRSTRRSTSMPTRWSLAPPLL